MDDLISRQTAIYAVHKEFDECLVWDESGETTADEVERILEDLPSAQPDENMIHLQKEQAYMQGWEEGREALRNMLSAQPENIRCKDCKYWDVQGYCVDFMTQDENGFCSWAERRTDE